MGPVLCVLCALCGQTPAEGFGRLGCFFVIEGVAGFIHDRLEGWLVIDRDVGQDLAVELDVGEFEAFDETAVGDPFSADCGTETGDPESAEIALAGLAVTVGPIFALHLRIFCVAEEFGTAAAISFRGCYDALAARPAGWSICGSWHVIKLRVWRGASLERLFVCLKSPDSPAP